MVCSYYLMFIIYWLLFTVKYFMFTIYYVLLQCFNVRWMKDILECGNCLSPTLVVNEEGDSHLGLAKRSINLIKDRTFLHKPFAWQQSDITLTHVKKYVTELKTWARSSKLQHKSFLCHGPHVKVTLFPCSDALGTQPEFNQVITGVWWTLLMIPISMTYVQVKYQLTLTFHHSWTLN